jgi:hypothetical protein
MFRLLSALLLAIVLISILGAAPNPQANPFPDPNNFIVYGVPWVLVGVVILGLLKRYAGVNDEVSALVSAGWAVVGYLTIQNLPDLETLLPWLPTYLPQVLWALILFGAQLGLVPGTTARRVVSAFRR